MVFDISKVFDEVWHKGLLSKLECLGISGPLLNWFESQLSDGKQQVVIEGRASDWSDIEVGVLQGSV